MVTFLVNDGNSKKNLDLWERVEGEENVLNDLEYVKKLMVNWGTLMACNARL